MLDLLGSWMVSIRSPSPDYTVLRTANLSAWIREMDLEALAQPRLTPDAGAIAALQTYVSTLEQQGLIPEDQGIWIQSGRNVLAQHMGTQPLPAASLTKIATTLVALKAWGANYQFETLISHTGTIQSGVLRGDLVIQGGGDPLFVWEEAIAIGNALQELGIQSVEGDLLISGAFAMNYKDEPGKAGRLFQQAVYAPWWPDEAAAQYAQMRPTPARPALRISGTVRSIDANRVQTLNAVPLIRHRSLPLIEMLKRMNIYSNNFIAERLADDLGGASAVAQQAAAIAAVPEAEIQLVNGSGLGVDNRLSARAVCAMLIAAQNLLVDSGWTIADVLPVSGIDIGTIRGRRIPRDAAVKTGTLAEVSSLAGALPTADQDVVWFAIINRGLDLDGLRDQQDWVLDALTENWSTIVPVPVAIARTPVSSNPDAVLGAPTRNERLGP